MLSMVSIAASQTNFYRVDSVTNALDVPLSQKAVRVALAAGQYTIKLTASDFRQNYGHPWPQRHVVAYASTLEGEMSDYRTFALNGIGDSQTITWAGGDLNLFFLDQTVLSDNIGGSTVEIKAGDSLVGTYRVDGYTNCLTPPYRLMPSA